MTMFQERETAFESKFAHEQDVQFRLMARRDKLFAQWVADALHLEAQGRAELVQSVLHVTNGPGHDDRLLAHVAARFTEHGQFPLDAYLAASLTRCQVEAQAHMLEA